MKAKIIGLFVVGALILAVGFMAGVSAVPNANAIPAANAQPAPAAAADPAEHPEIRAALESLHHAKDHLEHAAHDFGGHRVEAIRAIDEAQRQLDICLKFDR
jgi:hypothetical protein